MQRMMGLATQLIGLFFLSHDSFLLLWQRVSFSFSSSFGIIEYEKGKLEMTNPDSRCLAEVEGQPGLLLLLLPPPLSLA